MNGFYGRCLKMICWIMMTLPLFGEIAVEQLKVQQRWPWNGLVDITYVVRSTLKAPNGVPGEVWLTFSGYDRDRNRTVPLKTLSGDAAGKPVLPGQTCRTVWDMAKDYPDFNSSSFQVKVEAVARLRVDKKARNPWYEHHHFNDCYIAGINNYYPHYGREVSSMDQAAYINGMVVSHPLTLYVKVLRRPPDPATGFPGDRMITKAVLQYKILPAGQWVTVKSLEYDKGQLNYQHPVPLFSKNSMIFNGYPYGTQVLIRVYLSDGIYETGDLNSDIVTPVPNSVSWNRGDVYEGGWAAPFVLRVVLSGKKRAY